MSSEVQTVFWITDKVSYFLFSSFFNGSFPDYWLLLREQALKKIMAELGEQVVFHFLLVELIRILFLSPAHPESPDTSIGNSSLLYLVSEGK